MTTRIVITHLKGSKGLQIEQFPLDTTDEMTLGRDPSSTVAFDPQRDDVVSRRHAVIKITRGELPSFRLVDLGAANGTRLNGKKLVPQQEEELLPGEVIELGAGGPQFTFDLQPRPPGMVGRTRQMEAMSAGPERHTPATRQAAVIDVEPSPISASASQPHSSAERGAASKGSVVRMLAAQEQTHRRTLLYSIAGGLAAIAGVGGGVWYSTNTNPPRH